MTGPWERDPVLARVAFSITAQDLVDASRATLRWRYLRLGSFQAPLLLGFGMSVGAAAYAPHAAPWVLALPIPVVLATAVLLRLGDYLAVPRAARRAFAGKTAFYDTDWEVTLTQSGLRARSASSEVYQAWRHVRAWQEHERTIVVTMRSGTMHFIPRAAVTPELTEAFRTMLANVPKR